MAKQLVMLTPVKEVRHMGLGDVTTLFETDGKYFVVELDGSDGVMAWLSRVDVSGNACNYHEPWQFLPIFMMRHIKHDDVDVLAVAVPMHDWVCVK